jgi:hypothetical protein
MSELCSRGHAGYQGDYRRPPKPAEKDKRGDSLTKRVMNPANCISPDRATYRPRYVTVVRGPTQPTCRNTGIIKEHHYAHFNELSRKVALGGEVRLSGGLATNIAGPPQPVSHGTRGTGVWTTAVLQKSFQRCYRRGREMIITPPWLAHPTHPGKEGDVGQPLLLPVPAELRNSLLSPEQATRYQQGLDKHAAWRKQSHDASPASRAL